MRDSLFRTTRSAIIAALSSICPRGRAQRDALRLSRIDQDAHVHAGAAMDVRFACMSRCARDLRDQLRLVRRETHQMLADIGDATDTADIGIKVRVRELIEQAATLRGHLDQAVDATQATWDGYRAGFSGQSDGIRAGLLAAHQCVANHSV